jgi:hypothetical protein
VSDVDCQSIRCAPSSCTFIWLYLVASVIILLLFLKLVGGVCWGLPLFPRGAARKNNNMIQAEIKVYAVTWRLALPAEGAELRDKESSVEL